MRGWGLNMENIPEVEVKKGKRGKKKKVQREQIEPHELISSTEVEQIRQSLIETHADLVVRGMLDADVRSRLEDIVKRDYKHATKDNPDVIRYVVRETIGTGVIEEILNDESITDIGYNGSELIIESNDKKQRFDTNFEITDGYIVRLINKFANANNRDFTAKNPIFDGRFENVRINAVHEQNTAPESGTTMSLRVVRPRLALTEKNFDSFAPMFMYEFFRVAALGKLNMVISGITGTGKTELHKLIAGFIPFDDRIILIEDTPETFMKEMFPEKDIYSWVTTGGVNVTDMIKAGLRNHPVWMMVTETRGSEAYEMIQAVLTGHSIITSLHAVNARAIPTRFVSMSKMGYQLSEDALIKDIRTYFNLGIHINKLRYKGMVIRYLAEVIEFDPDGDKTIFKQRFMDGVFHFETLVLPHDFKYAMEENSLELDFPDNIKGSRALNEEHAKFEVSIPLNKDGRPDHDKLKRKGTTLDEIMGRDEIDTTSKSNADSDDIDNIDGFDSLDDNVYKDSIDKSITPEPLVFNNRDKHTAETVSDATASRVSEIRDKVTSDWSKGKYKDDNVSKELDDLSDIDAELNKILDSVNVTNTEKDVVRKPPIPASFHNRPKPKPVSHRSEKAKLQAEVRSIADIVAQKRKELKNDKI